MAALMESEIDDYKNQIRESVRPDFTSVGKKIGTPMIYGAKGTPWHNVLIVHDVGVDLVPFQRLTKGGRQPIVQYYHVGNHELPYVDMQTKPLEK